MQEVGDDADAGEVASEEGLCASTILHVDPRRSRRYGKRDTS